MEVGTGVIDIHAHWFPRAEADGLAAAAGEPTLGVDKRGSAGRVVVDGQVYREVTAPLWDLAARLKHLDLHGVAMQVISPMPILMAAATRSAAPLLAHRVNDGLAQHVEASRGRLVGLGVLPLHDLDASLVELRRAIGELGLRGVELPTRIGDRELDDPALEPLLAAAAELGAALFVHPLDVNRAIRRTAPPYGFGIGMLTDTALAATAVVTSGVLERHPDLRIAFAHGCGTLPWVAPRLRMALSAGDPDALATFDSSLRRLWADTLVFDPEHLRLVVSRFGAEHLMVGTDFPLVPGQLDGIRDLLTAALACGALQPEQLAGIARGNAERFLGYAPRGGGG